MQKRSKREEEFVYEFDIKELREVVYSDTPNGYEVFYSIVFDRPLPKHARKWIEQLYAARAEDRARIFKAFRGSTKTATFTHGFALYRTGLEPHKTGLLVQVGDDIAGDNTDIIRQTIEFNPAWRALFPHVAPDKERGWGTAGYWVKRADMPYHEWARIANEKDPSFVGLGYTSNAIIGKHPSNYLIVDDIHNEENTRSEREIEHVVKVYSDTITQTRTPHNPWMMMVGTPWTETDVMARAEASGGYAVTTTPVFEADGVTPTWPEVFGEERIAKVRAEDESMTGGVGFARMYLLDLAAAHNRFYVYHNFPADKVSMAWPFYGGVDYASVSNPTKTQESYRSHFGLCYLAQHPEGFAVVVDGVLEQCGQGEGEQYVMQAQRAFPNWQYCGIESAGKGEEFYAMLFRQPEFKVYPVKIGKASKADRLYKDLQPWLRLGRIVISDRQSKYLNALRHWLSAYPNIGEHDAGWDAADALLCALKTMEFQMALPKYEPELAQLRALKKKKPSPWTALAESRV